MSRGKPLHPAQLAELAELYAECGNASEVARALGVEPSTVTRALDRLGEQRRAKLQSDALDAGLRAGREDLDETRAEVAKLLLSELRAQKIEPDHAQKLGMTLARLTSGLVQMAQFELRRRQSRLTRRRTRAEITLLDKQIAKAAGPTAAGPIDRNDPRWGELQQEAYGAPRQGVSAADGTEPGRPDGDPDGVAEG
jgi:DNA-binding MarR family transcriptional regulator